MASTSTQTGNLLITIAASLAVCIAVARSMSYLSRRGGLSSSGQIKGNARGTGLLSRKNGLRTKIAQHHSPQKLSVSVACAEAKRGSQVVSAGSSKLEKVDKDNGELFDAIIFDMDGTLVSSTNLAHEATNTVLEEFGYNSITKHEYGQGTKYTTPVRLAWHAGIDDDDLAEKMGAAFDSSIIRLVTAENVPTFPGIKELLTEIRAAGIGMAVLSNASGKYVRRVNQAHSIAASFLVGLGADDVKRAKPSPAGTRGDRKRTVYIGDSVSDGQAAKAAGMVAIGVTWGENTRETLSAAATFDHIFDKVEELRSFLLAV